MGTGRHNKVDSFYMIWDIENQCFDSLMVYYSLEEALSDCEDRNHSLQRVEYVDDGNFEYVDELPEVYEVRKVTAERIAEQ